MTPIDMSVVERAGICTTHFAKLVGVSRVSAHMWLAGKYNPRGLYRRQVESLLTRIGKAVDSGALPLPPSTPRDKRFQAIEAALTN